MHTSEDVALEGSLPTPTNVVEADSNEANSTDKVFLFFIQLVLIVVRLGSNIIANIVKCLIHPVSKSCRCLSLVSFHPLEIFLTSLTPQKVACIEFHWEQKSLFNSIVCLWFFLIHRINDLVQFFPVLLECKLDSIDCRPFLVRRY